MQLPLPLRIIERDSTKRLLNDGHGTLRTATKTRVKCIPSIGSPRIRGLERLGPQREMSGERRDAIQSSQ